MVGHTVEHFGTYDVERLTKMSEPDFRAFVLACYGARKWVGASPHIHGTVSNDVLWIGKPDEADIITASNVRDFAQAVLQSRGPAERNAIMVAWNIDPLARAYAERVVLLGQQRPAQAIKLTLLALAGEEFRTLAVRRQEYRPLLTFVLRPDIPRIGVPVSYTHLDPQQLDQPLKGVHPEGTAVSALGYILGDHATIGTGHGIFLEETWRMHPDVCGFISEVFYEGRLRSRSDLSRLRLDAPSPLGGTGLRFVPVEHHGNQSASPEEVDVVARCV